MLAKVGFLIQLLVGLLLMIIINILAVLVIFTLGMSSSTNHICKTLPDGVNWGDNFIVGVYGSSLYLFLNNKISGNVFTSADTGSYVYYRSSYNSSSYNSFSKYTFNYSTGLWTSNGSISSTNPCNGSLLLYYDSNILSSSDGSVLYTSTQNIFKGLYQYNNFPYILNSQEDLAKGEEDLIIMPRRF